jgi:hypothetical protein
MRMKGHAFFTNPDLKTLASVVGQIAQSLRLAQATPICDCVTEPLQGATGSRGDYDSMWRKIAQDLHQDSHREVEQTATSAPAKPESCKSRAQGSGSAEVG